MLIAACGVSPLIGPDSDAFSVSAAVKKSSKAKKKSSSRQAPAKKKSASKSKASKKKSTRKKVVRQPYSVIYSDTATGEWIHKGLKGIIIHRDTAGVVRAMAPFTIPVSAGKDYLELLNSVADSLQGRGVAVYSLLAPTQGEFYMPPQVTENTSQQMAIEKASKLYLNSNVKPIFVCEALRKHRQEEIYNRTDHHWSPLGAYYAASEFAAQLGLEFAPLEEFRPDTVRNYVGTMFKFSGDPAVKNAPEDFIYYVTPGNYYAEFIDYTIANQQTVGESEKHEESLFRHYNDGSGAAYSTYLGGDNHTVRIVNRDNSSGRKLLIVKDSFGNAVAPDLIPSFEEVHVIDFRWFPHNLLQYVADNDITDLVFINCVELAFANSTTEKMTKLINKNI